MCAGSYLWHAEFLLASHKLLITVCRIQLPDQGSNWGPCTGSRALATGPSGKSQEKLLIWEYMSFIINTVRSAGGSNKDQIFEIIINIKVPEFATVVM